MDSKKQPKPKPKPLHYFGKDIFLSGKDDMRNEIIVFQHTYQDGSMETIGLRLNTPYKVGGKDVNGKIIKDWVYESYLTCDFNNTRKLSNAEVKAEENGGDESPCDISL